MKPGLEHIHKRKRAVNHLKKLRKYPSSKKGVRFLDRLLVVVAIIGPLFTLPQLYEIYFFKNTLGISMITWLLYAIVDIPWIVYGFVHKSKPIIITYLLWLIMNILVVVGTIIY